MSYEIPKCRITVIKRTINQDLIDEYLDDEYKDVGLCECFRDGQEIVIEDHSVVPDGFCSSAWADIRKDILTVAMGGSMPGIKQSGTMIVGCTDWFRPVIFKVERMVNE
ncbi:MAG TPA: TIGR04076 family protein [Dehalococcoidales bacterium]|nr:TIGR04076 family protein [Dehalococcoidales bacterium]